MSRRGTNLSVVVLAMLIAVVAGSGSAYALYKTTLTGKTLAAGSTTGTISLSSSATVSGGQLDPALSRSVTVSVANPSSSQTMQITSVTATLVRNASPSPKGACGVTKVHWTTTTSLPVTAIAGGAVVPVNGNVSMDTDVEDGCQGAAFTVTLTANGKFG